MTALAPGDLGIDYSYARPPIGEIVKAGAKFVLRYSAGAASAPSHPSHGANAGKLITPAEFSALVKAGLDVIANDEWYETRITEGSAAGHQDGAASFALWRSCGLNKGASIYVSWDAAVITGQLPGVDAYLAAFDTALGGYYHVDMYAGTPAIREMMRRHRIRYGWRPNAGSWSGDGLPYQPNTSTPARRAALVKQASAASPAHLWQTGNYWFSKNADENMIVRVPVGSHREAAVVPPKPKPPPGPAPTPKPKPTKDDVPMLLRFPNDTSNDTPTEKISSAAVYLLAGEALLWLSPDDYGPVELAYAPPIASIVKHRTSRLYKMPIVPGTPDPRVPGTPINA